MNTNVIAMRPVKLYDLQDLALALDPSGGYLITSPERQLQLKGQDALDFHDELRSLESRAKNEFEKKGFVYGLLAERIAVRG